MTVIAWDGKTLAADKRMSNGNLIITTTKIFRSGAMLAGIFGQLDCAEEMLAWLGRGAVPAEFPAVQRGDNKGGLLVIQRDAVLEYASTPYPTRIESPFFAVGSGRDLAMMAMRLGKTAVEAVELASEFDSGCGNGVDALEFCV